MPRRLEQWMYPINKTDLDVLRFAHFLALAAITVRFLPKDWPGLKSLWLRPLILCGQHSLEIFCLGVFLAFAGHFVLAEVSGGAVHALAGQRFRDPHHVRHGVGDFVVQALRRQGCIEDKKRPRQRRSGGRGRMRSAFWARVRTWLGLALLAGWAAAVAARAEDAATDLRGARLSPDQRKHASKVAEAIKSGQPLNILVVGSRSSTIPSSEASAYPARLQAALKEKLPQVPVNLSVELQSARNRRGNGRHAR